jgi:hypothetical protein
MTCADVQRCLPEIIDADRGSEFELHLRSCPACSELVAELELIAAEAKGLGDLHDPPDRVWVRISNQLRAEGIIRDQLDTAARSVVVPAPGRRWSAWWLAPVAAAVLAAGSYQLAHRTPSQMSTQVAQQPTQQQVAPSSQLPASSAQVAQQTPAPPSPSTNYPAQLANQQLAKNRVARPAQAPALAAEISPPANEEDQQFLSEVSQRAPTMRATYERQLRAVNAEIRETLEYIRLHPEDLDARQHLMETYQQKAMLYQMALDRIQ